MGCFPESLSVKIDVGVFFLVVFSRGSESYVSVEGAGISRTPGGNTGWKVTAACWLRTGEKWGGRGIPVPSSPLDLDVSPSSPFPPLPPGIPSH